MRYIRALVATAVWAKAYFQLCFHQASIWDRPSDFSQESMEAWEDRMREGVPRYDYERVEQLKEKAIALWVGGAKGGA